MLSSEDKPTNKGVANQQLNSENEDKWQKIDREQMFGLIDAIVSFEACLYHQILPLKLKDKELLLGIVNPQDNVAIDYVDNILSYLEIRMVTKIISAEIHREVLSAYLNYKNTSQSKVVVESKESTRSSSELQNAVLEEKPDSTGYKDVANVGKLNVSSDIFDNQIDNPIANSNLYPVQNIESEQLYKNVPSLDLPEANSLIAVEKISLLPPRQMLEELLSRVLAGGIGRLYLERRPYQGKILWSRNGVVQSVLNELPLSVFQGVLNELKRFTDIPVKTVVEAHQVEKEYLHKQQKLLIRLRIMPGMYGEEATLQVLRGAALKFYQQQQVSRLSKDALGISQRLCQKLHQLQSRLLQNRNNDPRTIESLEALNRLLDNLDEHIKNLY